MAAKPHAALRKKLLAYALSLPEAEEHHPWGENVAKVGGKIFFFGGRPENDFLAGLKLPLSRSAAPRGSSRPRRVRRSALPAGPPLVVAHELRERLPPARRAARPRILRRRRAADHHDLARGELVGDAEDLLRLGLLRRVTEPRDAAAVAEQVRAGEEPLGEPALVVREAQRVSAFERDCDPQWCRGEPVDVRA